MATNGALAIDVLVDAGSPPVPHHMTLTGANRSYTPRGNKVEMA